MGIMGKNTQLISNKWSCGWEYLYNYSRDGNIDDEIRANVIKDLVNCRDGECVIAGFTRDDVTLLLDYVSCY